MRGKRTLAEFWLTWEDGSDPFPGLDFASLLSNLSSAFSDGSFKILNTKCCKFCKTSIKDIARSGWLGCENCYKTFYSELLPYIKKLQHSVKHVGKKPAEHKAKLDDLYSRDKLNDLKEKLKIAIEKQEFEQAAILRDKIKALIKKEGNF